MKKIAVIFMCLLVFGAGTAFAEWAVGFGFIYVNHNAEWEDSDFISTPYFGYYGMSTRMNWMSMTAREERSSIGGFFFLDLGRFFEFNLALYQSSFKTTNVQISPSVIEIGPGMILPVSYSVEDASGLGLQAGLSLKVPFYLAPSFRIFPAVGLDTDTTFFSSGHDSTEFMLWLRFGLGLDVFLTQNVFLRNQFSFGLSLVDTRDFMEFTSGPSGIMFRIGVGYAF